MVLNQLKHDSLTFVQLWNVGVVLELKEAPLHHVLGIHLLYPQQVKNHVVRQSKLKTIHIIIFVTFGVFMRFSIRNGH
jgi:hypothetical protein